MYDGSARILIVDDDLAFVTIEGHNLRQRGYCVTTARDGEQALDLALDEQFDLIVTDHRMPGLSGIDFCRQVRTLPHYAAVPIILCTGKAFEINGAELERELSPARVLKKPISMSSLLELIGELLKPPIATGRAEETIVFSSR